MTVPDDAAFEVRVTKHLGSGFRVTVDGAGDSLSERDAILRAIELLLIHLENTSGLCSWDERAAEGLRRASG